ncbi:hypothetical protein KUCAC02_021946, partial [Chaenocephalus aceratus]
MCEGDSRLRRHYEAQPVFKGTSSTTQNELLDCMYDVSREEIAKQADNTSCVAVQADETTDVSCKSQMVIVLRYITPDLTVTERSLEFVEVKDTTGLREKLIAQTYDGAAVMSGNVRGVQTVMKETYPNATHEATQRRIPATGWTCPEKETDALAATAHDRTDEPGRGVSSTAPLADSSQHVRSCPPPELDCAVELWPALGNKEKLKSELTTLCRRSELHTGSTARSLLKSIHENNLEDT